MHWDGGGSLPDVVPVHPFEEAECLDVVKTFDSPLRIRAKSAKKNGNLFQITIQFVPKARRGVILSLSTSKYIRRCFSIDFRACCLQNYLLDFSSNLLLIQKYVHSMVGTIYRPGI